MPALEGDLAPTGAGEGLSPARLAWGSLGRGPGDANEPRQNVPSPFADLGATQPALFWGASVGPSREGLLPGTSPQ